MREDLIELAKQQAAEIARAGHNGWGNTMLALAVALESSVPVGVARAWQEGYRQGVLDERASEDNIGIAGFGAKVGPARNNPYTITQQPAAVDEATRRDAERYRWLRDNAGAWEASRDPGEWTRCETGEKFKPRVYFTAFGTGYGGMFLDDAIDAAMNRTNT